MEAFRILMRRMTAIEMLCHNSIIIAIFAEAIVLLTEWAIPTVPLQIWHFAILIAEPAIHFRPKQ